VYSKAKYYSSFETFQSYSQALSSRQLVRSERRPEDLHQLEVYRFFSNMLSRISAFFPDFGGRNPFSFYDEFVQRLRNLLHLLPFNVVQTGLIENGQEGDLPTFTK
jgi:hypothetical protein